MSTLVIILGQTREHERTFEKFKQNILNELNADLAICIGVRDNYDYNNLFYKTAKYKFTYKEPENYDDYLNQAYNDIVNTENVNKNDTKTWKDYTLALPSLATGSYSILMYLRHFLLNKLIENKIIEKYDRFIITRSDFIYNLPHPQLYILDSNNIWFPYGETYGGFTDRHVVCNKTNILIYLNLLNSLILYPDKYFDKMIARNQNNSIEKYWNIEQIIKHHIIENNYLDNVKFFPYIMYSVRSKDGITRWSVGNWNEKEQCYIKYENEYKSANHFKNIFDQKINNITNISTFYTLIIQRINCKKISKTW